jgi:hypothetical protein
MTNYFTDLRFVLFFNVRNFIFVFEILSIFLCFLTVTLVASMNSIEYSTSCNNVTRVVWNLGIYVIL